MAKQKTDQQITDPAKLLLLEVVNLHPGNVKSIINANPNLAREKPSGADRSYLMELCNLVITLDGDNIYISSTQPGASELIKTPVKIEDIHGKTYSEKMSVTDVIRSKMHEIAHLLIKAGVDVTEIVDGLSALDMAKANVFMDRAAEVIQNALNKCLRAAVENGSEEDLNRCLKAGADPETKDSRNQPLDQRASNLGYENIAALLQSAVLAKRAGVDSRTIPTGQNGGTNQPGLKKQSPTT